MAAEYRSTEQFRGARFHDVDLTGVKITDALLIDADLSGLITGLRVNDVEVAPLIEAELDRRHPERVLLRSTDADGLRAGWAAVADQWRSTNAAARALPEALRQQQVDGEWSLTETVRHLIFVIDAWFSRAVLGEARPYHPLGWAPGFLHDGAHLGLTMAAAATFEEVVAAHEQRMERVAAYLATVTAEDLARPRAANDDDGYPGPSGHTVLQCLHCVLDEEWWHHRYAARDLAVLAR